ncbi:MAG: hypothetical protein FWD82_05415, partial [Defluviitaleaceae bacterium]|nr:hypothetical protein [Defluviitaleaceae bacterium]
MQQNNNDFNPVLIDMIYSAISDEKGNEEHLTTLIGMALNERAKEILGEIRMDTRKHYNFLEEIYLSITGNSSDVTPNKKRAGKNLIREYEKSVFDALKEIEFYRKLMFMANENKIR